MASSDEEDLDALRLAALATLKPKAPPEPQGIQVVGSLGSLVGQPNNQFLQGSGPLPHLPRDEDYNEYGEVPFAFEQAVLQKQARGRGFHRGYQRGWGHDHRGRGQRGRGRGRGFPFPPKPQSSALIVIQVAGGEDDKPAMNTTKPPESRPFLLRPQDKWAATSSTAAPSSPQKPKEKSKFSRYDDDSDSDEDDDERQRRRRESVNDEWDDDDDDDDNMAVLDNTSQENEVEVHRVVNIVNKAAAEGSIEVHKHDDSITEKTVNNSGENMDESLADISDNIILGDQGEVSPQKNDNKEIILDSATEVKQTQDEVKYSEIVENKSVNMSVINESDNALAETMVTAIDNIPGDVSESATPLRDEVRQEDSVSNSYISFSRFNRRGRRGSESGEESEAESLPSSRNSSKSRDSDNTPPKSVSDFNSEPELDSVSDTENLLASEIGNSTKEKAVSEKTKVKTTMQSQDSNRSSVSSRSKSSTKQSDSSSSSSSSSDSDTEASSSSRQPSPKSTSKGLSQLRRHSLSQNPSDKQTHSIPPVTQHKADLTTKKLNTEVQKTIMVSKGSHKVSLSKDSKNSSAAGRIRDRSMERDSLKPNRPDKRQKSPVSPSPRYRRSHTPETKKPYRKVTNDIKADPEFDAANYRDDSMYKSNSKQSKFGRNTREEVKLKKNDKRDNHSDRDRAKISVKCKLDTKTEVRHFKEISKLRKEARNDGSSSSELRDSDWTSSRQKLKGSERDSFHKDKGSTKRSQSPVVKKKDDKERNFPVTKKKDDESKTTSERIRSDKKKNSHNSKSEKELTDREISKKVSDKRQLNQKIRRQNSSDLKQQKTSDKSMKSAKRRSIEEKLKKVANLAESSSSSSSDSESDKSVSSLSDSSSDSESETWRDKKHGGSRKTTDIELERRRRRLQEREQKRVQDREKVRNRTSDKDTRYDRGQDYRNRHEKHIRGDRNERDQSYKNDVSHGKHASKGDLFDNRGKMDESDIRQKTYRRKNMTFYEEEPVFKKKFEEMSSESDTDIKQKGSVKVVRNDRKGKANIPSLLDLKVSKPKVDERGDKKGSKRLIVQVQNPSDEEGTREKSSKKKHKIKKKKKKKHRDDTSSEEEEEMVDRGDQKHGIKQVVNVTFGEKAPDKLKLSVKERLGLPVSKKKSDSHSAGGGVKRAQEVVLPPGGKRIKLSESGKHRDSSKHKHKTPDETGEGKDTLERRIEKIKEKNAQILLRKREIDHDKQIYG